MEFFGEVCICDGRGNEETLDKTENIRQLQRLFSIALWISFQLKQCTESAHFAVVWWHEPRVWNRACLEVFRLRCHVDVPLLCYNSVEERGEQLWAYGLSERDPGTVCKDTGLYHLIVCSGSGILTVSEI